MTSEERQVGDVAATLPVPANRVAVRIQDMTLADLGRTLFQSGYYSDVTSASQAVAKIIRGQELGIGPIAALENLHFINGRMTLSAALMASLVNRHPNYRYQVLESDDSHCLIQFSARGGDGWYSLGQSSFSMAEAERAGLVKGTNWQHYPADMLFARAISRGVRRYCPDVVNGAVYTPEELALGGESALAPIEAEALVQGDAPAESAEPATPDKSLSDPVIQATIRSSRATTPTVVPEHTPASEPALEEQGELLDPLKLPLEDEKGPQLDEQDVDLAEMYLLGEAVGRDADAVDAMIAKRFSGLSADKLAGPQRRTMIDTLRRMAQEKT